MLNTTPSSALVHPSWFDRNVTWSVNDTALHLVSADGRETADIPLSRFAAVDARLVDALHLTVAHELKKTGLGCTGLMLRCLLQHYIQPLVLMDMDLQHRPIAHIFYLDTGLEDCVFVRALRYKPFLASGGPGTGGVVECVTDVHAATVCVSKRSLNTHYPGWLDRYQTLISLDMPKDVWLSHLFFSEIKCSEMLVLPATLAVHGLD